LRFDNGNRAIRDHAVDGKDRHLFAILDSGSYSSWSGAVLDPTKANQIGIVLNFAAGFLLAPNLIGTERIQRWEARMESAGFFLAGFVPAVGQRKHHLHTKVLLFLALAVVSPIVTVIGYVQVVQPRGNGFWNNVLVVSFFPVLIVFLFTLMVLFRSETHEERDATLGRYLRIYPAISIVLSAIIVVGFGWTTLILILGFNFLWVMIIVPSTLHLRNEPTRKKITVALLISVFGWPVLTLGTVFVPIATLFLGFGWLLLYVADPDRNVLQDRLVVLGIVTFIAGNALQLYATL
jgi:hypothetical protein